MKVFWSWQSDTDGDSGRFFVRDALKEAIKKLKQPPGLAEPHERDLRDGIHLDHDRKDVSGTPSIADVIFKKIDATDVFVADVTPVATLTRLRPSEGEEPEKKLINANVAIEYGYAVRAVTDELILLVQNLLYGNRRGLPFDLQHKGSPIQYRLAPDAPKAEQNAVKDKLVVDLFVALRSCLVTLAKSAPPGPKFDEIKPRDGNRAFFWKQNEILGRLGTRHPFGVMHIEDDVYEYRFEWHQALYLRLIPSVSHSGHFTFDRLMNIVEHKRAVRVMSSVPLGGTPYRNSYGAIYYRSSGDNMTPTSFTQLHTNGEIWSVTRECWASLPDMEVVAPVGVRNLLLLGLQNSVEVMQESLGIGPPYEVEIGMIGLKGTCLARPLGQGRRMVYGHNYTEPVQSDPEPVRLILNDPEAASQENVAQLFVRRIYALAGLDPPEEA
jgi:hypothetical protein